METPEFFDTTTTTTIAGFLEKHRFNNEDCTDNFIVEELLDLPNDDAIGGIEVAMTDLSTDCCNFSFSTTLADPPHFHPPDISAAPTPAPAHFSNDFPVPVPYEDLAELEWLSNFVEESFSSDDLQKQQLIQLGMKAQTQTQTGDHTSQTPLYQFQPDSTIRPTPIFNSEMPVPAKTRSKRSRAAPGNWTSRLLAVSHNPNSFSSPATISSSSESDKKLVVVKQGQHKKKLESSENSREDRKCLHCATDKTPQWRTGPMGPKTLCNACGVRYKSGRLVREYRPAASPTFVLTKHSNSHRKVMELRRQKELMKAQQQHHQQQQQQHFLHHHQSMIFDVSSSNADDYLIHQHIGPDFRRLI